MPIQARRHRPHRQLIGLTALVGVLGCGAALDVALTSAPPNSIVGLDAAAAATSPVVGVEGLTPGGPAQLVAMSFGNPATGNPATGKALLVTAVTLDPSALPADCPAMAWHTSVAAPSRVIAAGAHSEVRLDVGLTWDAPTSCQGLTVALRGTITTNGATGGSLRADASGSVVIGTLGTPGLTVSERDGRLVAQPAPAGSGRIPSAYTVEAIGPGGLRTTVCAASDPRACVDATAPAQTRIAYQVTARLGAAWRRASAIVEVSTPPRPVRSGANAGCDGQLTQRCSGTLRMRRISRE